MSLCNFLFFPSFSVKKDRFLLKGVREEKERSMDFFKVEKAKGRKKHAKYIFEEEDRSEFRTSQNLCL